MKTHEETLDERSRKILRELIIEYCLTGEPVGSRTLSRRGASGLSPATIRNVLSDLEEQGFIQQPHTSAGRIPTDKGYRFYVNHLMRSQHLNPSQKELIQSKIRPGTGNLEDVLKITAGLLATLSHSIALAMSPDLNKMTLENMDFVLISRNKILAILVTRGGVVSNKVVDLEYPVSQDELVRMVNYIRGEFCGQTLPLIRRRIIELMKQDQTQYDLILKRAMLLSQKAMESYSDREQLYVIGASQIMNFPEFADVAKTKDLLEALEQKSKILHILNACIEGQGLHILIGSENPDPGLKQLSLISSPYNYDGQPVGTVGILGPTRMEYGKMIPLVDHIAKVISDILTGNGEKRNS